jgi:hypothetical protein
METEKLKLQSEGTEKIKNIAYRFENCGEGHGVPENFVRVIVYESGRIEKQLVETKDDEMLKK